MRLSVIGCNHRTAPLALRERLAFDDTRAAAALASFRESFPGAEAVLLPTCNRTELYVARPLHGRPRNPDAARWLADQRGLTEAELADRIYHHDEIEAVRHLFRVSVGLDSMVLGETQIVGQISRAVELAREATTLGPALSSLFDRARAVARRVRRRTGIDEGRFSLGGVAAELAEQIFPRFDDKTVLLLGAGKAGETTLRHFLSRGPRRVWLTNRTLDRAGSLAARLRAEVRPFDRIEEWVEESDVVVACLTSSRPVLTCQRLRHVPARRVGRPLLFVDMGVPRNIDPALRSFPGFHLFDLDDLTELADADRIRRQSSLHQGERLVEHCAVEFQRDRARRESAPIIKAFRRHLESIAALEFERFVPNPGLDGAPAPHRARLLLHRVVSKMLHSPTVELQRLAEEGKAEAYGEMLERLFRLPTDNRHP